MISGHSLQLFICSPQRLTCFFIFSLGQSFSHWHLIFFVHFPSPHTPKRWVSHHRLLCPSWKPNWCLTAKRSQSGWHAQLTADFQILACLIHLATWQAWSLLLHFGFCFLVFGFFLYSFFFLFQKDKKGSLARCVSCCHKLEVPCMGLLDRGALLIARWFAHFPSQKWLQRGCGVRADVSIFAANSNFFLSAPQKIWPRVTDFCCKALPLQMI